MTTPAHPIVLRQLAFLDASPTPFHAVEVAARILAEQGFVEIDPKASPAAMGPGFRGFEKRGGTLLAVRVGNKPVVEAGFRVVAAHTDSPNLRVKPQPYVRSNGYVRLGVEVYGGVIYATWADRDLGLAGRILVKTPSGPEPRLVDIRRPLCRIPSLAIHLNREVNSEGLKLNAQKELPALFALDGDDKDPLRTLLAAELGVSADEILTWDLMLVDLTAATLSGLNQEFLHSARLDNLGSSHAGLEALVASLADEPAATSVLALFDHEEIGSLTARGADSRILEDLLGRVAGGHDGGLSRALANSVLASCDMAHAVHPAFADKHDGEHMPKLNQGPVIKQNSNQRYGTEGTTSALIVWLAERAAVPVQWFVNRTDLACGTTVGPMLASRLGCATVDLGNPMLSMHSAREMCGAKDQEQMVKLLTAFYAS